MSAKWRRSRAWDDRVFPPALWPLKALLRALSSIWLAVLTLVLTALYLAAGSAPIVPIRHADVRRWVHAWEPLEWTPDQYYSAWPLTALLALFILNMIVATVRRIEFRWINAGVLTVHTGIVLLATGAAVDAASRERGELFLAAGSPAEWVDRFTVAGEIELFVEVGGERATHALQGLPRYRAHARSDAGPFLRWTPPINGAPELAVYTYAPRARIRDAWVGTEGEGVPAWSLEWSGAAAEQWRGLLPADSDRKSVIRLPDGTRLAHLSPADDEGRAIATVAAPGDADAFLTMDSDARPRLVPVWPGAKLLDEKTGVSIEILSIDRFSVVPSAIAQCEVATISPALIALVRRGEEPARTVVLLADAPTSSYEITDSLTDPPSVSVLSADPLLSRFAFIDAATPSVTLHGLEAVVRSPGGAITGPFRVEPGGQLDLGEGSRLRFVRFTESLGPVGVLEPLSRSALSPSEVGSRVHAAVSVRAGDGSAIVWLPVTRWGTGDESVLLPDGRSASFGVSLISRPLPAAQFSLERLEQEPSGAAGDVVAHLSHRIGVVAPSQPASIALNHPLRWTAPREPASRLSHLFDTLAPVHWQAAMAGWDEEAPLRSEGGRFVLLSINSSAGVELIAVGGVLIVLGSPVALLLKPWLMRRRAAGGLA